jgi:hypothetical protein
VLPNNPLAGLRPILTSRVPTSSLTRSAKVGKLSQGPVVRVADGEDGL